jgi:hypothetical protein
MFAPYCAAIFRQKESGTLWKRMFEMTYRVDDRSADEGARSSPSETSLFFFIASNGTVSSDVACFE